ncbi:dTDP-4-dehydrorhamnose 3,5-epimerase [Pelistega ratti]|uniref:dTDP-4-dehydrorhamnose 3,5-epimerase n=1 Tax=Pelistega ratti TaxID=2652177 RepID=UPI001357C051|nr:dTDP-4-dehydrorhamnose 3,5-epimerase [Pelistega ratti]
MKIRDTAISDVKVLIPQIWEDTRGFFMETFREEWFNTHIADCRFVQENYSTSYQGVLRGLHYQTKQTQGKLIHVLEGEIFDVVVDLRRQSPTFKQWVGTTLSAENKYQLWVPEGFAHGFYVLSQQASIMYKCTDYYCPHAEQTLLWNDPELNIHWPLKGEPILSEKDKKGVLLKEAVAFDR